MSECDYVRVITGVCHFMCHTVCGNQRVAWKTEIWDRGFTSGTSSCDDMMMLSVREYCDIAIRI